MLTLLVVGVSLAAIGNVIWFGINFRIERRTKKYCEAMVLSADNYHERAKQLFTKLSTMAEKNATDYRVCEQCGKIVLGICKDCVAKVLVH